MKAFKKFIPFLLAVVPLQSVLTANAQEILPPVPAWKGKSLSLIAEKNSKWITPTERSDFSTTPSYKETMAWLTNASSSTELFHLVSIGKSSSGRDINMLIASADKNVSAADLKASAKPLLLMQAGIHEGEIDGKDAGMMLLRDIAFGTKKNLLDKVNILFIPILNVDGHERSTEYNRINQRGPSNMGWRTNARNLNLNRDYSKLDTEEIRAVAGVMNTYDPDLYLDLHVTDGADYQYDITYGFSDGYSPSISQWLKNVLSPEIDNALKMNGHIPGPLIFATNNRDFENGVVEYPYSARFSNNYGDIRHLPSILVENHSLKPFRQRVLGTYVFLEAVIKALASKGSTLQSAIDADRSAKNKEVVLTWKGAPEPETMTLLGIRSERKKSQVTGKDYVQWSGIPVTEKVPLYKNNVPDKKAVKPRSIWVPGSYGDVIQRIKLHGVIVEEIAEERSIKVRMARIKNFKFASTPFEGHIGVSGEAVYEERTETFYPGSVRISLDQPLGDLVMHLLEPESPDSFLQWGFFHEIFNRTEYAEEYAMEPLAIKMLTDQKIREAFEEKKKKEPEFINDPDAVYEWFYAQSPYVDSRYLLYPVGMED